MADVEYVSAPFTGTPRGVNPWEQINWSAIPTDVAVDIGRIAIARRQQEQEQARQRLADQMAAKQWAEQEAVRKDIASGIDAQATIMRHPRAFGSFDRWATLATGDVGYGPVRIEEPSPGLKYAVRGHTFYPVTSKSSVGLTPAQAAEGAVRTQALLSEVFKHGAADEEFKASPEYQQQTNTLQRNLNYFQSQMPQMPMAAPNPNDPAAAPQVPVPSVGPDAASGQLEVPPANAPQEVVKKWLNEQGRMVQSQHPNWTKDQVKNFVVNYLKNKRR